MKKLLIGVLVLTGTMSVSAQDKVELKNSTDSLTYSIGISVGNVFKTNLDKIPGGSNKSDSVKMGFKAGFVNEPAFVLGMQYAINAMMQIKAMSEESQVNTALLFKAFNDGMDGTNLQMAIEAANAYPQTYKSPKQKAEAEKLLADNKAFFEKNKKAKGIITTKSGLQYKVIKKSKGQTPTADDMVKVNYRGTLLDGTEFDKGDSIEFPAGNLIPGFTEGLQLMPVGAKYMFYIPSNLGYGERGAGQQIKPNSGLIFEVELLEIVKKEEPKEETK